MNSNTSLEAQNLDYNINTNNNTTLLLVSFTEAEAANRPRLYEEVPVDQVESEMAGSIEITERDQWSNKLEYMLSVIGYVVDLGNCVRFPYVAYKNGGGAFLVPYFLFLFLIGVPMMYLEMSISQFFQVGNIRLWQEVNPYMKGIGYSSLLVVCYITLYYTTIIAYSVYYLFDSIVDPLPWSTCNNAWNTQDCRLNVFKNVTESSLTANSTSKTPAEEYFNNNVLGIDKSAGIHDLGPVKYDLTAYLALVYFTMYLCICNGVKGTGKAVYVTAILPYVILVVLLVHGIGLEGSANGVYFFLMPNFSKLLDFGCWSDAAVQVFFTLGPGISVLTTYGSYSKRTNNCQIDALVASTANVIASILSGVVVFSSLGNLSFKIGKDIDVISNSDLGLSFIAYPDLLATFTYSKTFSVIFFLMIINLGLDSNFGGLEAIYTALADEFWFIRKYRKTCMALIHLILFLSSLPTVTYGGNYLVTFLDTFATSPALMLIVLMETLSVAWLYDVDKFVAQNYEMFGVRANIFWKVCWKYLSPCIILFLFFSSIVWFEAPVHGNTYKYPLGYLGLGWCLNISAMLPIPLWMIYRYFSKSS